jgi:hypothetical protein
MRRDRNIETIVIHRHCQIIVKILKLVVYT